MVSIRMLEYNFWGSILSFHMGSRDQTQVVGRGDKYFD